MTAHPTSASFPNGLPSLRSESEVRSARAAKELPKPCPWCGIDPPLAAQKMGPASFRNYMVGCENDECPAQPAVSGHTVSEAWDRWNMRAKI
jgi:hypothetical protein